jgi:hypothetical protein
VFKEKSGPPQGKIKGISKITGGAAAISSPTLRAGIARHDRKRPSFVTAEPYQRTWNGIWDD